MSPCYRRGDICLDGLGENLALDSCDLLCEIGFGDFANTPRRGDGSSKVGLGRLSECLLLALNKRVRKVCLDGLREGLTLDSCDWLRDISFDNLIDSSWPSDLSSNISFNCLTKRPRLGSRY